jgi:ABC-2 type transport system permease protein
MSALSGTGPLLGLALRRDRMLIPASVIALTIYAVGSAQATVALYADAQTAMAELGSVLNSPSTLTLYGPATTTSIEGLSIFKTLLMGSVFVGLLAFAIVRRHTRVEEEDGRLELVGAGAVGRQAPLTAAVLLAIATTVLVGALSAGGMAALGFPARGSLAFGAAWAISGLLMTGVTAVACQLTATARGATGWALGTLGVRSVTQRRARQLARCTGSHRWDGSTRSSRSARTDSGCSASQPWWPGSWSLVPSCCSNAATSVPACCPVAPDGHERHARSAGRSAWPGASRDRR